MKRINQFLEHGILYALLSLVCGLFLYLVGLGSSLLVSFMTQDFAVYDALYYSGIFAVFFLALVFLGIFLVLRALGVFSARKFCRKISDALKSVFGWGIMLCLFAGGLTFFGYLAALVIGGDVAAEICRVLSGEIFPVIIYASTVMVLLGLTSMYFGGEKALTSEKKESAKHEGEL